jgi:chorismate mutase
MPKTFYTERDIEDMAKQGVTSIVVTDDVVVTDAGREKAPRVGITLLTERQAAAQAAALPKQAAAKPQPAAGSAPMPAPAAPVSTADLEARVYNAVKAKLGGQVDDALLRTIVKRVLMSLGR